jgi:hypothetical protein
MTEKFEKNDYFLLGGQSPQRLAVIKANEQSRLENSPELETERMESVCGLNETSTRREDVTHLKVRVLARSGTRMPTCTPLSTGHSRKRLMRLQSAARRSLP